MAAFEEAIAAPGAAAAMQHDGVRARHARGAHRALSCASASTCVVQLRNPCSRHSADASSSHASPSASSVPRCAEPVLREREQRGRAVVRPSERGRDVERGEQVLLRDVVLPEQRRELAHVGGDRALARDAVERHLGRRTAR